MSPAERAGASTAQYLDRKVSALKEILELTSLEHKAIEENNATELSNIIAKKKALMGQVDVLDKRAAAAAHGLSDRADARIPNLKRHARDILAKLAEAGCRNRALLEGKAGETKAELAELRGLRQARKAYVKKDEKPGTNFLAR